MEKYVFENQSIRLVIEEDSIGFYLIVYKDPSSSKSSADYLLDSLDQAFRMAREDYGIKQDQWSKY